MSNITIQRIGITEVKADVVVNAANSALAAGGGVCGYIFDAAGYDKLTKACNEIGHCDTGSAVITPAFDMDAKYIIHAVGPRYSGRQSDAEELYGAYEASLKLAQENDCVSIAFPLISSGIFGYPVEDAWIQAIHACLDFIEDNPDYEIDIIFACLDSKIIQIGEKILNDLKADVVEGNKESALATACTYCMPEMAGDGIAEDWFFDSKVDVGIFGEANMGAILYTEGNEIEISFEPDGGRPVSGKFKINYCPMCGRKLR